MWFLEKRKYNAKLRKCCCTMLEHSALLRNLQQCYRSEQKWIFEENSWLFPLTVLWFTAQSGLRAHAIGMSWMKLSQMGSRTVPTSAIAHSSTGPRPSHSLDQSKPSHTHLVLEMNRLAPLICWYRPVLPTTVHITRVTSTNFAIWKDVYVNENPAMDFRAG